MASKRHLKSDFTFIVSLLRFTFLVFWYFGYLHLVTLSTFQALRFWGLCKLKVSRKKWLSKRLELQVTRSSNWFIFWSNPTFNDRSRVFTLGFEYFTWVAFSRFKMELCYNTIYIFFCTEQRRLSNCRRKATMWSIAWWGLTLLL